ncbi:undecaprenyl-phosphate glucose phosphotransferase [Cycloclasticus sp. 46_120_T64]|nr:undecaprenyl-phosphate glucose phosphotransferase [Cycloclasticus sp. 46_120_T64]
MTGQGKIRRYDSKINAISRLIDSAIIFLTFVSVLAFSDADWAGAYLPIVFSAVILFSFFAESQDAYRSWRGTGMRAEVDAVLFSWVVSVLLLVVVDLLVFKLHVYEQFFMQAWLLIVPIELICWHALVRSILRYFRSKGYNTRQVAIVGATPLGDRLRLMFQRMDWMGLKFIGYYDDRVRVSGDRRLADDAIVIGNIAQLVDDCKSGKVDTVYITLAMSAEQRIKRLIDKLANSTASVYLVPDLFTFKLLNSRWVDYQGITAISIYETPFSGVDSLLKRLEDIIFSSIILSIIALPMLIIAGGIKLTSAGPVFFKQKRYGADGREIKVWKFRSMTVQDDGADVKQATKGDARITPFGAFIRKTSLDELPQFFNVLTGRMSIVGPRPHAVAHNEEYREKILGYMLRHKVKPGITGLAQISGFRGETDTLDKMEGRIKYDLKYIQTWSIRLDLKIIFLTIFKGFVDKNAY